MLLVCPINSTILLGLDRLVKYSTIQSSAGALATAKNREGQDGLLLVGQRAQQLHISGVGDGQGSKATPSEAITL